jgi:hypothetical protein
MRLGRRPAVWRTFSLPEDLAFCGNPPSVADSHKTFSWVGSFTQGKKSGIVPLFLPWANICNPSGYILEAFPSWKRSFHCAGLTQCPVLKKMSVNQSQPEEAAALVFSFDSLPHPTNL